MERAEQIGLEALKCADFYEQSPGLDSHLSTIDLYRAIARLARIIEAQQKKLDHLMPDRSDDI